MLRNRDWPVGFNSHKEIAPGSRVVVTAHPQIKIKVHTLMIPWGIASNFVIDDIRVGRDSQFAAVEPISAEAYSFQTITSESLEDLEKSLSLGIPAEVFSFVGDRLKREPQGFDGRLGPNLRQLNMVWDLCSIAMEISIHVRNISDKPAQFRALAIGTGPES